MKIRESESENEYNDEVDEKPFGSDNGDFYDPIFDGSDDDAPKSIEKKDKEFLI